MLNGEPELEDSGNKSRLGLGVWDRLGALGTSWYPHETAWTTRSPGLSEQL
jgi:hypothetical protein